MEREERTDVRVIGREERVCEVIEIGGLPNQGVPYRTRIPFAKIEIEIENGMRMRGIEVPVTKPQETYDWIRRNYPGLEDYAEDIIRAVYS